MSIIVALILYLSTIWAVAESPQANDYGVSLYLENDTKKLGGPGSDRDYTNGFRLSYLYAEHRIPKWGRFLTEGDSVLAKHLASSQYNFGIGLGQQIYTPEDMNSTQLLVDDRPYAGWLFLSFLVNIKNEGYLDTFELDAGVVGPESQAEFTQRRVHEWLEIDRPRGWHNQLKTEPGFVLSYQHRNRFYEYENNGVKVFDFIPFVGASAGNILTAANGGTLVRFGYNLPRDFGPTRPSGGDGDAFLDNVHHQHDWSFYLFLGAKESLVLRNIFLDGNTFQDSHRVSKRNFVTEFEGGFGFRISHVGVIWRHVVRSPEFYQRDNFTSFGSLTLSYFNVF